MWFGHYRYYFFIVFFFNIVSFRHRNFISTKWVSGERNFSCRFIQIFLMLWMCFRYSMNVGMWFGLTHTTLMIRFFNGVLIACLGMVLTHRTLMIIIFNGVLIAYLGMVHVLTHKTLMIRIFNCMLGDQPKHGRQLAFLFNCTPVGRTSDSMTVPT